MDRVATAWLRAEERCPAAAARRSAGNPGSIRTDTDVSRIRASMDVSIDFETLIRVSSMIVASDPIDGAVGEFGT
ncbi:hypothetical protein SSCG_00262 [Streptomyces clavuligerus]|nr:hypothetical protein SSCG_00262 [Streptomyces clavuligerus]